MSNPGEADVVFPEHYSGGGAETSKSYQRRRTDGFFARYFSGPVVLDVGYRGAGNESGETIVPHAIGVDLDYPGYDGLTLPFADESVDCVSSSHCLEHILFAERVIEDWYRVVKVGGYIVTIVPHQHLYEKRRYLPSVFNPDHKRMFTGGSLLSLFEQVLPTNSYRIRHLVDNDIGFNYEYGPDVHSSGSYEIELVIEKLRRPSWSLA